MNTASRVSRGIVATFAAFMLLSTPALAAAAGAGVITKQVLPQGGSSCAPLFVKSVTPYIYDGELDSFDIVLSDPAYVGVLGAAGDVSIPFSYMTRRIDPDGSLRLHIDTTAKIDGKLPVTITLLSALPNAPVCLSQVSFTTDAKGAIETSSPAAVSPAPISSASSTVLNGTGSMPETHVKTPVIHRASHGATNEGQVSRPTSLVGTTSSTSTIGSLIATMCSKNGSYQLWFILLAIFFVITAFVGLSEPALALRHGALPAILIGVPLVALLLFWHFESGCRLSYFIPVILLVAAAIGLYSAYRTNPVMRPVMALPEEKKTVITKTEENN